MRLRHIEVFHAVMKTGSISRAADYLAVSQPTASKILQHAESSLGFPLFKRAGGRLVPTREAELLYKEALPLHDALDKVRRLAKNLAEHPGGRLRIGCLPSLAFGLIPLTVKAFRESMPEVSLQIQTQYSEELVAQILSHELDIAVSFDVAVPKGVVRTEVGIASVVHIRSVASASTDKIAGCGHTSFRLNDLDDDWIGIGEMDPLGSAIAEAASAAGAGDLSPMIEARTYYMAAALVDQGLGYALVDEFTAKASRCSTSIQHLVPPVTIGVVALMGEAQAASVASTAFTAALKRQFEETLPR